LFPENPKPPGDNSIPAISDAYEGVDDGGRTYKPDPSADLPKGEDCEIWKVTAIVRLQGEPPGSPGEEYSGRFYAPISFVGVGAAPLEGSPEPDNAIVTCRGNADFVSCGDQQNAALVLNNVIECRLVSLIKE
jgi:hypothetical protein